MDAGPAQAAGLSVSLQAPAGWTVRPSSPTEVGSLGAGAKTSQSWTVTAPRSSKSTETAALQARASYTSAGSPESMVHTEQAAPPPAPLPPPVISSVSPSTTKAGTAVTLTGHNFGASQGKSYLTLAEGGTSWGAPYDGAKLTITAWSNTSITFDLPPGSGPYPLVPGTANITATVIGQTSNAKTISITGSTPSPVPVLSGVSPSSAAPGAAVTLTGHDFGASQGDSYLTLAQPGTSWGAPYDGAKLTITAWSNTSITFDLPPGSGTFPVKPGPATITVTVGGQSSQPGQINVT